MRDIWLVVRHDVGVTLRQRSFWFLTMFMPLLLMGLNAFSTIRDSNRGGVNLDAGRETESSSTDPALIGLVDKSGLITEFPAGLASELFVHFPDQPSARSALEADEIEQFVHIPEDYIDTGQVTVYDRDFQILQSGQTMGVAFGGDNEWLLQYLIDFNLTRDARLADILRNPLPAKRTQPIALRPPAATDAEKQALAEVVASVMPYIYYFLLVLGGSYLMRAVVAEKENRTVEVLLLSLEPRKLMTGKIVAMSLVMSLQLAVWVGGGVLILNRGADLMNVASFDFPPGFWLWAVLFLVLGYLAYAAVMAAAGAIAPTAREGAQVTWLLILPLLPTLMFGRTFFENPHGTLALVLSLFPLSAPGAMVTRLAVAEVPLWQILLSLAGLAVTAYLSITLAGRFFSAGNLLSADPFNWRRFATGWRQPRN